MGRSELNVVIGLGNEYRRDDAVGLYVARKVSELGPAGVRVVEGVGHGASLLEVWDGMETAFVVDAVVASGSAGRIYRFRPLVARLPVSIFTALSTHGLNVAKAIELGKELGRIPRSMVVYGIEGADFSAGIGLTPEVARAAGEVVDSIGCELARVSKGARAKSDAMTARD